MSAWNSLDLGNLLLGVAILFGGLILLFEAIERRREGRRLRSLLDSIEAEYRDCQRMGLF